MTPDDIARRRAGKRFNERLKLAATFLNTTGIATMVGTLIIPALQDITRVTLQQWASIREPSPYIFLPRWS